MKSLQPKRLASIILAVLMTLALIGSAFAAAGDLDPTFGTNGIVTTHFPVGGRTRVTLDEVIRVQGAALQSDGKTVIAGEVYTNSQYNIAVIRLTTDGLQDTSFGSGGVATVDYGGNEYANDLSMDSAGKFAVAGTTSNGASGTEDMLVALFNSDGTPDTNFSTDGIATVDFGATHERAYAVLLLSDGRVLLAGYTNISSNQSFALAMLKADGTLDTSFDTDGLATTDITYSSSEVINDLAIQTISGTDRSSKNSNACPKPSTPTTGPSKSTPNSMPPAKTTAAPASDI